MSVETEVIIMEEHGGFIIRIDEHHPNNITSTEFFHFDQEDSLEGLVTVFEKLGFSSKYEEVY